MQSFGGNAFYLTDHFADDRIGIVRRYPTEGSTERRAPGQCCQKFTEKCGTHDVFHHAPSISTVYFTERLSVEDTYCGRKHQTCEWFPVLVR
jgi:hypothetical protein